MSTRVIRESHSSSEFALTNFHSFSEKQLHHVNSMAALEKCASLFYALSVADLCTIECQWSLKVNAAEFGRDSVSDLPGENRAESVRQGVVGRRHELLIWWNARTA